MTKKPSRTRKFLLDKTKPEDHEIVMKMNYAQITKILNNVMAILGRNPENQRATMKDLAKFPPYFKGFSIEALLSKNIRFKKTFELTLEATAPLNPQEQEELAGLIEEKFDLLWRGCLTDLYLKPAPSDLPLQTIKIKINPDTIYRFRLMASCYNWPDSTLRDWIWKEFGK